MTRAAVVGLGLIGGSVALGAGARGWDRDAAVRERARRRGIDAADSLAEAVAGAGLVVAAVPTSETAALLREIAALAPGAILTDCASLKTPVADAAGTLPVDTRFVAGHPMAGGRGRGVEGADRRNLPGSPVGARPHGAQRRRVVRGRSRRSSGPSARGPSRSTPGATTAR